MCDQISDAILDAYLKVDSKAKVAAEVATKSNLIFVFGEITSSAHVDIEAVVRDTIKRIGYDSPEKGNVSLDKGNQFALTNEPFSSLNFPPRLRLPQLRDQARPREAEPRDCLWRAREPRR